MGKGDTGVIQRGLSIAEARPSNEGPCWRLAQGRSDSDCCAFTNCDLLLFLCGRTDSDYRALSGGVRSRSILHLRALSTLAVLIAQFGSRPGRWGAHESAAATANAHAPLLTSRK